MKNKLTFLMLLTIFILTHTFCIKHDSESSEGIETNLNQPPTEEKDLQTIESEFWYVSNKDGVYLRKSPSPSAEPIRYALNEEVFEIIGKRKKIEIVNNNKGSWFLIKFHNGVYGWVFSAYLSIGKLNQHIKNAKLDPNILLETDTAISKDHHFFLYPEPKIDQSKAIKIFDFSEDNFIKIEEITNKEVINNFQYGNWLKVKYGDQSGYASSTELTPYFGNCTKYTKTFDKEDTSWIMNLNINEIVNNENWNLFKTGSYYINFQDYSSALIVHADIYYLILFKRYARCNTGNSMGLVKILDIKTIPVNLKTEKASMQTDDGVVCKNKTNWEEEIFAVTNKKTQNNLYKIARAYRINLISEKIEQINTNDIQCYEYCEVVNCE
ncbi:SH3 domain-containing protein [Leptospira bandrabouensis]|uniref:SH3 domain-containing protein n=1 Tax=Leptospira bandrabouensis TaxID=2484903 RepID=UPI001EEBE087|nr:SH3 domain-containing protein [Leptospira bandrabouensis]MCG6146618.1 SH3 domain-containing protein [Leptospira bandrabouensis]MCG6166195.1 SH3 domain-containing protein [Leptospira bandrabouensis]